MDSAPHMSSVAADSVQYARTAAPRGRWRHRWLLAAVVVVVLAGSVAVLSLTDVRARLFGRPAGESSMYVVKPEDLSISLNEEGELKPKKSVEIKCELEGQSTILSVVEESKKVQKGDLLVELASDAIKERLDAEEIELSKSESSAEAAQEELALTRHENTSKLSKCEITLQVAELELRRYVEGDFVRSLAAADMSIAQTKMDIKRKKDDLAKNEELKEKGFVTQTKLDELEFELKKTEMTLEQDVLARQILLDYEKPKNETEKQSDVDQARQELERERQRADSREKQALARVDEQHKLLDMRTKRVGKLREQYGKCKIYAPVDGTVQYPNEESNWRFGGNRVAAGEKAFEGQALLILPDTNQMVVSTRIHEADRHKVREDLPCEITVPAVPGRTFSGRISRITQFADTTNRWLNPDLKEHAAEILLDETDAPVSPGDSAKIKIFIDEVPHALAVPVQCVFSRGPKNYVFARRGGTSGFVEVRLGPANTSMVQVTEGLSAGDEVLMHVSDTLLATLPAAPAAPNGTRPEVAAAIKKVLQPASKPAPAAGGESPVATQPTAVVTPTTQPAGSPPVTSRPAASG